MFVQFLAVVTKLRFMKLGNCFSKFVNLSSSFPQLFLDLTTTEPEPELFSFGLFWGAGARADKARQARLELEPRSSSLDISGDMYLVINLFHAIDTIDMKVVQWQWTV